MDFLFPKSESMVTCIGWVWVEQGSLSSLSSPQPSLSCPVLKASTGCHVLSLSPFPGTMHALHLNPVCPLALPASQQRPWACPLQTRCSQHTHRANGLPDSAHLFTLKYKPVLCLLLLMHAHRETGEPSSPLTPVFQTCLSFFLTTGISICYHHYYLLSLPIRCFISWHNICLQGKPTALPRDNNTYQNLW